MKLELEKRIKMAKKLEEIQQEFQAENARKIIEKKKSRDGLSIISDIIFGVAILVLIVVAVMHYLGINMVAPLEEYSLAVSLVFLVLMIISLSLKLFSQKRDNGA